MKLAIFGATGRTGRPLLQQALAAGHSVAVLVRVPAKLTTHHASLRVINGDVTDAVQVAQTVAGSRGRAK